MELTRSEMEIMDVLWEAGKPLSRADLLEHTEEKTWKDSSVHILLNSLLQKGRHSGGRSCKAGQNLWPRICADRNPGGILCQHHFQPSPQAGTRRSVPGAAEAGGSHPGGSKAAIGACAERNTVRDWRSRLCGSAFLLEIHAGFPWGSGTGFAAAPHRIPVSRTTDRPSRLHFVENCTKIIEYCTKFGKPD